jgi:hypothetical protein
MKPRCVTSNDESGKRRVIIDACLRMNAPGINQGMLPAWQHNGCLHIGRSPQLSEPAIEIARGKTPGHGRADV